MGTAERGGRDYEMLVSFEMGIKQYRCGLRAGPAAVLVAVVAAGLTATAAGQTVQQRTRDGVWWLPENVSTTGPYIDRLFNIVLIETGVAFIAVAASLLYFAFRYRQRPGHRAVHDHGDQRKHLFLTLGLAIVVFIAIDMNIVRIANADMKRYQQGIPDPNKSLVVNVLAEQFRWNIIYPGRDGRFGTIDDLIVTNQMHVPVNEPVLVRLRSRDVIHSFFLPHLRLKMDCVPGMSTAVWFQATRSGSYELACAELCGWGHYGMRGRLVVEPRPKFEQWLQRQYTEMERAQ